MNSTVFNETKVNIEIEKGTEYAILREFYDSSTSHFVTACIPDC